MARTFSEILLSVRNEFISNITLQGIYGLDVSKSWDEQFSTVSVESALTYVFSFCIYLYEQIINSKIEEIASKIATEHEFSIPWYYAISKAFQLGDSLEFDDNTYKHEYAVIDATKQIVKYVAVRQRQIYGLTKLQIFASKENKIALTSDELAAFSSYINKKGAAGTHFDFVSLNPDLLDIHIAVYYDAMYIKNTGESLSTGIKVVDQAINSYLDNIEYGGQFNRTKLIDAIQSVTGVNDVEIGAIYLNEDLNNSRQFESQSGFYKANLISATYYAG